MKKMIINVFLMILILNSCSKELTLEEKAAFNKHLQNVLLLEADYIAQLKKRLTKEKYQQLVENFKKDVLKLIDEKEMLQKTYPSLKKLNINISDIPVEYEKIYKEIIINIYTINLLDAKEVMKYNGDVNV